MSIAGIGSVNTWLGRLRPPRGKAASTVGSFSARQTLVSQSELIELSHRARRLAAPASIRHAVAHRTLGDVRSVYRGQGMDYDESRPYFTGDELRFMNWRVTARTGAPHIKVFREERNPGLVLVIDRRSGMCFGTRTRLKAAQAVRVAGWLAFAARKTNMSVEAVLLDQSLMRIQGGATERDIHRVIAMANAPCKPVNHAVASPSLHSLLQRLPDLLICGSHVVLISDLHDLDPSCRSPLLRVSGENQVEVVRVADPAEMALPAAGRLIAHADTSTAVVIDTTDQQARKRYEMQADKSRTASSQLLKELAIPCTTVMTDEDSLDKLVL